MAVSGVGREGVAVASGWAHSLVVRADGTVIAWGRNSRGQLGDGTKVERTKAVGVRGLEDVVAVAGGEVHSLALRRGGSVVAWGAANAMPQMRDETRKPRLRPVAVSDLHGRVSAIAAGRSNSLALLEDGSVVGWGGAFVDVEGLVGVVAVACGYYHYLALDESGVVLAWGSNLDGALGDGTTPTTLRSCPEPVRGLGGSVVAVAAGADHSLALMENGSVMAWGLNISGQVGTGRFGNKETLPVSVAELEGEAIAIAAGGGSSFALLRDGRVMSWGQNDEGQLGDGMATNRCSPGLVPGLGVGVRAIASRVALMADGSVCRWGGELPNDDAGADAHIEVGASKLGGSPDLPADTPWPTDAERPMVFVGQINFAEVAGLVEDRGLLPPAGVLSLFVVSDDIGPSNRFHVHFTEAPVALSRAKPPAELADGERFEPVALRPEHELSLPPPQSAVLGGLGLSASETAAYESIVESDDEPTHRVLGYPSLPDQAHYRDSDDRCLLLQVDSDDTTGMIWGDLGRLFLWIDRDDLTARRFDRATLEFEQ